MLQKFKKEAGFTLIEMLVVIGIVIVVAFIVVPISVVQLQGNKLESETKKLKSSMHNQQQYAYSAREDSAYGIVFNSGNYVLYQGDSYATATVTETIDLTNEVDIVQINFADSSSEVNFAKNEFRPSTTGNIVISDGINSYTININSQGLIETTKN